MAAAKLACPKCGADLGGRLEMPGAVVACPSCGRAVEGAVFAAFHRPRVEGKAAEALVAAEDAGCFYHPQSRAQVPCDACGRFLCALCDVEIQGQHLCPACINAGTKKRKIQTLDESRMMWGGLACLLALLPLFFWPVTLITGPLSVFIALYGWRKPQSVTGTRRLSYLVAILAGLTETVLWVWLLINLIARK